MARIRSIKPEFWEDEKIASLPYPCRLFFIGTWNHADDNGVIRGNASILKSKIFPYDDSLRVGEVSKWIDALVNARMLVPISHKDESYYVIRTFHSHQKFDARYPNYLIPKEEFELLYPHSESTAGAQRVHDESTSWEGEGEEGKGEEYIPPFIPPTGETQTPFQKFDSWVKSNLPGVSKVARQITEAEYAKLLEMYNKQQIRDVLEQMENKPNLHRRYKWVYKTALNWLKNGK